MSPSPRSQQILKLEEEVGERLFERARRRTLLTEAGALLLPHALGILDAAERGRQEIREMDGQVRGRIVLGVLPTIAPYLLPALLAAFRRKHPAVELLVHEETTAQLLRGLEEGEIDLALISDAPPTPRVALEILGGEELLLCLPARHPLLRRKAVVAADLEKEKFILMQEGHCLGAQTHQFCRTKGFQPRIGCRSAQLGTVQSLVQAGLGISLIPAMARRGPPLPGIAYRSLDGLRPRRSLTLALPQGRKPGLAVLEFVRALRLQVAGLK